MVELTVEEILKVKALEDYDNEDELQQLLDDTKDFVLRRKIRVALRALKARNDREVRQNNRNATVRKPITNSSLADAKATECKSIQNTNSCELNVKQNEEENDSSNSERNFAIQNPPSKTIASDIKKNDRHSTNIGAKISQVNSKSDKLDNKTEKIEQNTKSVLKRFPLANQAEKSISKNDPELGASKDASVRNRYKPSEPERKTTTANKPPTYDFRSALRSSKDRVQNSNAQQSTTTCNNSSISPTKELGNSLTGSKTFIEVYPKSDLDASDELTHSIKSIDKTETKEQDIPVISSPKQENYKIDDNVINANEDENAQNVKPVNVKTSIESANNNIEQRYNSVKKSSALNPSPSSELEDTTLVNSPNTINIGVQNLGDKTRTISQDSSKTSNFLNRLNKFNQDFTDSKQTKKQIIDNFKSKVQRNEMDSKKGPVENPQKSKILNDKPSTNSVIGEVKQVENLSIQIDSKKDATENSQNSKTIVGEPPMNYVEDKTKPVENLGIQLGKTNPNNLNIELLRDTKQINIENQDKPGESREATPGSDDVSKQNIQQDTNCSASVNFSSPAEKSKHDITAVQRPSVDLQSVEPSHSQNYPDRSEQETNKSCEQSNKLDDRPRLPSLSSYKARKDQSGIGNKNNTTSTDMPSSLKKFHNDKALAPQDKIKDFRSVLRKRNEQQDKQPSDNKNVNTASGSVSDGIKRFSTLKDNLKPVNPKVDDKSNQKRESQVAQRNLKKAGSTDTVQDSIREKTSFNNSETKEDNNIKDVSLNGNLSNANHQRNNEVVKTELHENAEIENTTKTSPRVNNDKSSLDSEHKGSNLASSLIDQSDKQVIHESTSKVLSSTTITEETSSKYSYKESKQILKSSVKSQSVQPTYVSKNKSFGKLNIDYSKTETSNQSTSSYKSKDFTPLADQTDVSGSDQSKKNVVATRGQFLSTADRGNDQKPKDKLIDWKTMNSEKAKKNKNLFKEVYNREASQTTIKTSANANINFPKSDTRSESNNDQSNSNMAQSNNSNLEVKSKSLSARAAFFTGKKDDKTTSSSSRFKKDEDQMKQTKTPSEKLSRFNSRLIDQNNLVKGDTPTKNDSYTIPDKNEGSNCTQKSVPSKNAEKAKTHQDPVTNTTDTIKFHKNLKKEISQEKFVNQIDREKKSIVGSDNANSQPSHRRDLKKEHTGEEFRQIPNENGSVNKIEARENLKEAKTQEGFAPNDEEIKVVSSSNTKKEDIKIADLKDNVNETPNEVMHSDGTLVKPSKEVNSDSHASMSHNGSNIINKINKSSDNPAHREASIENSDSKIKGSPNQLEDKTVHRRKKNFPFQIRDPATLRQDKRRETFIEFSEEPSSPKVIRAISVLEPIQKVPPSVTGEKAGNPDKTNNTANITNSASTPNSPTPTPKSTNISPLFKMNNKTADRKQNPQTPSSSSVTQAKKATAPAAGYVRRFDTKKFAGGNTGNDPKSKRPSVAKPFVANAAKAPQPEKKQKKSGLKDLFKKATKSDPVKKPTESTTTAPAVKPTPKTEGSVSAILLQWCKQHTKGFEYKDIMVKDLSRSWADGLAFCALLNNLIGQDTIPMDDLDTTTKEKNFTLAFEAFDKVGIAPLLDVEDMLIMYPRPDQRCVMTYLLTIYSRYKDS